MLLPCLNHAPERGKRGAHGHEPQPHRKALGFALSEAVPKASAVFRKAACARKSPASSSRLGAGVATSAQQGAGSRSIITNASASSLKSFKIQFLFVS
jgi:hypothetical protein